MSPSSVRGLESSSNIEILAAWPFGPLTWPLGFLALPDSLLCLLGLLLRIRTARGGRIGPCR